MRAEGEKFVDRRADSDTGGGVADPAVAVPEAGAQAASLPRHTFAARGLLVAHPDPGAGRCVEL